MTRVSWVTCLYLSSTRKRRKLLADNVTVRRGEQYSEMIPASFTSKITWAYSLFQVQIFIFQSENQPEKS